VFKFDKQVEVLHQGCLLPKIKNMLLPGALGIKPRETLVETPGSFHRRPIQAK
jgi:hypothetical protein